MSKPTMPNSPASSPKEVPESRETIRQRLEREIAANPRFVAKPTTGKGFVIGGVKPAK